MLSKILVCSYVKDTINYVLCKNDSTKEHRFLFSENLPFTENSELLLRALRNREEYHIGKNVKNKLIHCILSFPAGEKELFETDSALLEDVCREWIKMMKGRGYEFDSFFAVQHLNTKNTHVHLIISRFNLDGKLVNDSYIGLNAKLSSIAVTEKFGLIPTKQNNHLENYNRALNLGDVKNYNCSSTAITNFKVDVQMQTDSPVRKNSNEDDEYEVVNGKKVKKRGWAR